MKKMKGVVGVSESLPYGVYEDAKTRLKHQNLMQEYQELHKETEATRNKLQSAKQKKLTLLAEVRFLRHKFEHLIQNQTKKSRPEQHSAQVQRQQQKSEIRSKNVKKGRNYSGKEAALRSQMTNAYNGKEKIDSGPEAALRTPVPNFALYQKERNSIDPNFELNQKGRIYSGMEAGLRNSTPVFNLNEGINKGKEVATRNPVPVFDLNQISGEEEEFQAYSEPMKVEGPNKCLINGVIDERQNDMKISSVCRNLGNGPKRAGKRKISWQDQVALRV